MNYKNIYYKKINISKMHILFKCLYINRDSNIDADRIDKICCIITRIDLNRKFRWVKKYTYLNYILCRF